MADQFLNKTGLTRLWSKVKTYIDTKLPLTGGKLTGNLEIQPTGTPNLTLTAPENENVGRSKTVLMKNASTTSDYGTQLIDYVWGDATNSNARVALALNRNVSLTKNLIRLVSYDDGGTSTTYLLYGEHNPPAVANITGLDTALSGKSDTGHTHSYLPLSGGTLTGPLSIQRASGTPSITLLTQEKEGVGPARALLYKNANASTDNGTALVDYVWGDGGANNKSVRLVLLANSAYMPNLIRIRYDDGEGGSTIYRLYGEHYKPTAGDIESGTFDAERLPVVPITKGGTGATDTLAALTALGGLSALDHGTPLATNGNINTLLTPGTYYSPSADRSATITGAPVAGAGFRLFVMVGHNTQTTIQIANVNGKLLIRSTPDQGATWTDWDEFSKVGHIHNASSITAGTLDAARLPLATASTRGAVVLGASGGAAAYSHTHTIANVTGLQSALDNKATSDHTHDAGDIDSGTLDAARLPAATSSTQGAVKLGATGGAAAYSHTHSYLPLSGGTLTGSLTMDPTGTSSPILTLITADATNGPARTTLFKNANASADSGTQLTDYAWGDGTSSNQRTMLRLRSSATQLADRITLIDYAAGGSSTTYRFYGDHYRPMIDGQIVMAGTEDLNTMTTIGWYICRSNALSRQVKHTPNFDTTTLVNSSMVSFNMTIGRIGSNYIYQELLLFNTGKRWYRYTANPTAASPSWGAWNEH